MSYPILFDRYENDFNHNGVGVLNDAISCEIHEVLNGQFELLMEYPANARYAKEFKDYMIIKAKPNDTDEMHEFRIYDIAISVSEKRVTIKAMTKTNDIGNNLVMEYDSVIEVTPQTALNSILTNSVDPYTYSFYSDISSTSRITWVRRNPLNCLMGERGSLLDIFGGELKRGNNTIYWYKRRGNDNVATIRPRKNLKGMRMTSSTKGMVTKILPYIQIPDAEGGEPTTLVGTIVRSPLDDYYPIHPIVPVNFASIDDTITDISSLNTVASKYFTTLNPGCDRPKTNLVVDLLSLQDSSEYTSKFKNLEKIGLGDTVTVYHPDYDVDIELKVRELYYDAMRFRNVKMSIGDPPTSGNDAMLGSVSQQVQDTKNYMYNVLPGVVQSIVQKTADGLNDIYTGPDEPSINGKKIGDIWFKEKGSGVRDLYMFDGAYWQPVITEDILQEIEDIATNADIASQEALDLISGINDEILYINSEFTTMKNNVDSNISNLEQEVSATQGSLLATDNKAQQAIRDAGFVAQDLSTLESITEGVSQKALDALDRANLANQGLGGLQTKVDGIDVNILNLGTELGSLNISVTNQGTTIGGIQAGLGNVTNQVNEFGTVIGKSGLDMGWEPGGVSDITGSPISDPDKIRSRQQDADHALPFIAQTKAGGVVPMDVYEYNLAAAPTTDIMPIAAYTRFTNAGIPMFNLPGSTSGPFLPYVDSSYTQLLGSLPDPTSSGSSSTKLTASARSITYEGLRRTPIDNTLTTVDMVLALDGVTMVRGGINANGTDNDTATTWRTEHLLRTGPIVIRNSGPSELSLMAMEYDSNGTVVWTSSWDQLKIPAYTGSLKYTFNTPEATSVRFYSTSDNARFGVNIKIRAYSLKFYSDLQIAKIEGVTISQNRLQLGSDHSIAVFNVTSGTWNLVADFKNTGDPVDIYIPISVDNIDFDSGRIYFVIIGTIVSSDPFTSTSLTWTVKFANQYGFVFNPSDYNYSSLYGKKSITDGVYLAGEDVDMVRFVVAKNSEVMMFNDTERRNYDNTIRAEIQGVSDRLSITSAAVDNNTVSVSDLTLRADGLDFSVTEISNRLTDVQTSIPGHIYVWYDGTLSTSDGSELTNATISRIKFVDVVEGSRVRFVNSRTSATEVNVFRYNINKGFMSYSTLSIPASDTYMYIVPAGVGYIRATIAKALNTSMSISKYDDSIIAYELRINQLEVKANSTTNTISQMQIDMNDKVTVTAFNQVKSTVDAHTITISNIDGRLVTNETTINGVKTSVTNKADKTEVATLASQWSTTTSLVNGHTSQISSLGTEINLAVSKGDVVGRINVQAGKTLIQQGTNVLMITETTTYISDATIKTAHIANAAITNAKIATLDAGKITTGILDASKITVTNLVITNTMIAVNSISGDKITTISGNKITTGTIDASIVTISKLNASNITTGTINGAVINVVNLNASSITSGTINGNLVNVTNLNASNITAGTLDVSRLTGNVGAFVGKGINGFSSTLTFNPDNIQIKNTMKGYTLYGSTVVSFTPNGTTNISQKHIFDFENGTYSHPFRFMSRLTAPNIHSSSFYGATAQDGWSNQFKFYYDTGDSYPFTITKNSGASVDLGFLNSTAKIRIENHQLQFYSTATGWKRLA